MKIYHMLIQPAASFDDETENRRVYMSARQGSAPQGWKCVGVLGYHEPPEHETHEPAWRDDQD